VFVAGLERLLYPTVLSLIHLPTIPFGIMPSGTVRRLRCPGGCASGGLWRVFRGHGAMRSLNLGHSSKFSYRLEVFEKLVVRDYSVLFHDLLVYELLIRR